MSPDTATAGQAAEAALPGPSDVSPGRLRAALHLALAVLALATVLLAWQGHSAERLRDDTARALAGVAREQALTQRIGLQAQVAFAEPGAGLAQTEQMVSLLARARTEAGVVQGPLRRAAAGAGAAAASAGLAIDGWDDARERLWLLASPPEGGEAVDPGARTQAVQAGADAALAASRTLLDALEAAAAERDREARQRADLLTALMLGMLLATALFAVEPAVRSLDRANRERTRRAPGSDVDGAGAERTEALASAEPSPASPVDRAPGEPMPVPLTARAVAAVEGPVSELPSELPVAAEPLPDREAVLERVRRCFQQARRRNGHGFAVLSIEVAGLQQADDTLGRAAVARLRQRIAQRVQATLRPGDAIEAPMATPLATHGGGDAFVVVLGRVRTPDEAMRVAERVHAALAEREELDGSAIDARACIGIAMGGTPVDGDDAAEQLLHDAETAMAEARHAGSGRTVLFEAALREREARQRALDADLQRAAAADEFFVAYQPIVELPGGGVQAVEALVRWRHPQRGVLLPAEFLQAAEGAGLLDPLGDFVLRTACGQFASWRMQLGSLAPARLAVNVSAAQLASADLVERVQAALAEAGLTAAELQLEVGEDAAGPEGDRPLPLQSLLALKAMGVRLALDGFGSGSTSLACLYRLPVQVVKIDRSLVAQAETSDYHRVLVESTVRVARAVGLAVEAEGIETARQAALMHELQCDRGQGDTFSPPLSADAFGAWLRAGAGGVGLLARQDRPRRSA